MGKITEDELAMLSPEEREALEGETENKSTEEIKAEEEAEIAAKAKEAFAKLLAGIGDSVTGPILLTPHAFTAEGNRVAVETERDRAARVADSFCPDDEDHTGACVARAIGAWIRRSK